MIAVLGAGAWGTAVSILLAKKHKVKLWARDADLVNSINASRFNNKYLQGVELPASITASNNIIDTVAHANIVVIATPMRGLRDLLKSNWVTIKHKIVVLLTKGIEKETSLLPHEIFIELGGNIELLAILSGPNFANELAQGLVTATVICGKNADVLYSLKEIFSADNFIVDLSNDLHGVGISAAMKNVVAIASGVSEGLGLGRNSSAMLFTVGLQEIRTVFKIKGGGIESLLGLAGIGDLVLSSHASLSRNYSFGFRLASGKSLSDIYANMHSVIEGVDTVKGLMTLAEANNICLPITKLIYDLIYGVESISNIKQRILDISKLAFK